MAISDELSRIVSAKAAIKTALENKGLTIGDSSKLGEYPAEINKIDTSTLLKLIDRSITKITIPSGITSIGSNTFNQCLNLKDVSINSNITSIGSNAFSNCDALVQINIPSSVTSIETEAFSGNDRLYAVDFLGTPSITKLKLGTFYNCPQLTYIEIPESVTELEANVFQNCTSLTTIKIPSGVTKIGNSAFSGCSAMMHFVCMATTPPTISSNTFSSYHYSNVKLHVPASAVSAYQNASNWSNFTSINGIENIQFEDAKVKQYLLSAGYGSNGEITTGEVASILRFPKLTKPLNCYYVGTTFMEYKDMGPFMYKYGYNVKGRTDISTFNELKYFNLGGFSINPRELFYSTSLTSMELPDDLKTIPPELFALAYSLNHLIIPNSVTKIGYGAFYMCQSLKGLVIPASVTEIEAVGSNGDSTLSGVPQVTFISQVPPTITHGLNIWGSNLKIYVPKTALQTYRTTSLYPMNNSSLLILPIVDITYDSLTLTAQAIGRPYGQEMYIDGSLLNTSTYTFDSTTLAGNHTVTVKCVDPSLGVLDEVSLEVLIEGEIDYSTLYFGLTAIQDASVGLTGQKTVDMKYSSDGENWTQWDYANETLNLPAGETLYFKGDNSTGFYSNNGERRRFVLNTGKVNASGNIQSLVYDDNFVNNNTIPCNYCFAYLFYNCTALTTAPVLPATTLAQNCYSYMFVGCTSLTTAPVLPATTLANGCYSYMFGEGYGNKGCTSLTTAPVLPATTLARYCYQNMFNGCTGLTTAPELPATTLASLCYFGMFYGCTGLTTAPELAATTLASLCYQEMFCDCTGLTTAPELPATTLVESCYRDMFNGCTGLTTAPELPATTLVGACYWNMFRYCSNLNYIKAMFTSNPDQIMWVQNVSSTGTFVMNAAATWDPEDYRGTSGIPAGWTVEKVTA